MLKCKKCSKVFNRKSGLGKHELTCKGDAVSRCNFCGEDIVGGENFKVHCQQCILKEKSFKCNHCQKDYKQWQYLQAHKRYCKVSKCRVCEATFKNGESLANHYAICMKKHFICELCGEKCNTEERLAVHKEKQH